MEPSLRCWGCEEARGGIWPPLGALVVVIGLHRADGRCVVPISAPCQRSGLRIVSSREGPVWWAERGWAEVCTKFRRVPAARGQRGGVDRSVARRIWGRMSTSAL